MKAGQNVWVNDVGQYKRSETRPETNHPLEKWMPVYSDRRIHGNTYEPYPGDSEWEQAADESMAERVRG